LVRETILRFDKGVVRLRLRSKHPAQNRTPPKNLHRSEQHSRFALEGMVSKSRVAVPEEMASRWDIAVLV
jgi:hypothetical protein